MNQQTNEQSKR